MLLRRDKICCKGKKTSWTSPYTDNRTIYLKITMKFTMHGITCVLLQLDTTHLPQCFIIHQEIISYKTADRSRRLENAALMRDHARAMGMGRFITSMTPVTSTSQFQMPSLFQNSQPVAQARDRFSPRNSILPLNFMPNPNGLALAKMEPPTLKFEENPYIPKDEGKEAKSCLICGDRATGLHYGIISCEGCKGFFKRSICNKRVYRCTRNRNCVMSRKQRNRCQYCRLLKCLQMGMNRKAIREDGMPGGRNKSIGPVRISEDEIERIMSGKEFEDDNLRDSQFRMDSGINSLSPGASVNPFFPFYAANMTGGSISPSISHASHTNHFQTTATSVFNSTFSPGFPNHTSQYNPYMAIHNRRLRSPDSSSELSSGALVEQLLKAENMSELDSVTNCQYLVYKQINKEQLLKSLCSIADEMLFRQIEWVKKLPFYKTITIKDHTILLSATWAEHTLLAALCIHEPQLLGTLADVTNNYHPAEEEISWFSGRDMEILEHMALLYHRFSQLKVDKEEFVIMKIINFLNQDIHGLQEPDLVEEINKRYWYACQRFTELKALERNMVDRPNGVVATRFRDLMLCLPEIRMIAAKLLNTSVHKLPVLLKAVLHTCRLQSIQAGRQTDTQSQPDDNEESASVNGNASASGGSEDAASRENPSPPPSKLQPLNANLGT